MVKPLFRRGTVMSFCQSDPSGSDLSRGSRSGRDAHEEGFALRSVIDGRKGRGEPLREHRAFVHAVVHADRNLAAPDGAGTGLSHLPPLFPRDREGVVAAKKKAIQRLEDQATERGGKSVVSGFHR